MDGCKHKSVKRIFPFGRKSKPRRYCRARGKPIISKELHTRRNKKPPLKTGQEIKPKRPSVLIGRF